MKIAFDIDDTITKRPDIFKTLMVSLKDHRIYVLTGSLKTNTDLKELKEWRINQLKDIGIEEDMYDELMIATAKDVNGVAKEKGRICAEKKIDIFIDDTDIYLEEAEKQSPDTLTLKVK